MSVNIKIHRGANQVGGTITEIYTENTHIFVDFGAELSVRPEESTDARMIEMMQNSRCDAVLFSHYHGDHVGLMCHIPEKDIEGKPILLGMGKVARQVLQNIHEELSEVKRASVEFRREHKHLLIQLKRDDRWENFSEGHQFRVGDFTITTVRVDHSACDAYLFIIEAEGRCIVHTGDFRTHGRLGKGFFGRLKKHLEGRSVDVLLIEGTMMGRLSENIMTEEELQQKAVVTLSKPENKHAFLVCSSTNVESLASFHNAALKLGRPFIVTSYVMKQLALYRDTAGMENDNFKFWKSYEFDWRQQFNPKLGMTQQEFMKKNGFVMWVKEGHEKRMELFRDCDPLLIYSMWNGYLDKDNDAYNSELAELCDGWRIDRELHTSGHASKEAIESMIKLAAPRQAVIPVHTEHGKNFGNLDIEEYSAKVKHPEDGQVYVLQ